MAILPLFGAYVCVLHVYVCTRVWMHDMQAYVHIIVYACVFVNTVHISAGDKWRMVAAHIHVECLNLFNPLTLAVASLVYTNTSNRPHYSMDESLLPTACTFKQYLASMLKYAGTPV